LEAAVWAREVDPSRHAAFDLALFEAFFERVEDVGDPAVLLRIGDSVGLDRSGLREALWDRRYRSLVWQEHLEATDQGIHGIPAILIPGQRMLVGAVPYPDLRRAVESALQGAAGTQERAGSPSKILQEGTAFF
jgi:predicted DsbA family dithiol-disulfide isomerase